MDFSEFDFERPNRLLGLSESEETDVLAEGIYVTVFAEREFMLDRFCKAGCRRKILAIPENSPQTGRYLTVTGPFPHQDFRNPVTFQGVLKPTGPVFVRVAVTDECLIAEACQKSSPF